MYVPGIELTFSLSAFRVGGMTGGVDRFSFDFPNSVALFYTGREKPERRIFSNRNLDTQLNTVTLNIDNRKVIYKSKFYLSMKSVQNQ